MSVRATLLVILFLHYDTALGLLEYNIKTFRMANMDYKQFLQQPMDVHRMGAHKVFVMDTVRNRLLEYTVDDTNRFLFINHREISFEGEDRAHEQYRHRIVHCTKDTSESFMVLGARDGVFYRYSLESGMMVQENMLTERLSPLLSQGFFLTDVAMSDRAVTKGCMSAITGSNQYPFFVLDGENKKIYSFSNKISGHKQTFQLPLKLQSPVAIELVSEDDVSYELLVSDYLTGSIYRCLYQYDVDYYLVPTDHCWERVAGQGIRGSLVDGSVYSSVLLGPGSMQSVWDGNNVIFLDQDPKTRMSRFRVLWLKPNASDCFVETLNFVSSVERGSEDGGYEFGSFDALWDFSFNGIVKELMFAEILTRKVRIVQNVDIARCDRPGLYLDGILCKSCPEDHYCVGDGTRKKCPAGSYSRESSKDFVECYCPKGYTSIKDMTNYNITCNECERNVVCNEEEGFHGPCPDNSVGLNAFYFSDCLCNAGFKKDPTGFFCVMCDSTRDICEPPRIDLGFNYSIRVDTNKLVKFNSNIFVQVFHRFVRDNTGIVVSPTDIFVSFYGLGGEFYGTSRNLLQIRSLPTISDIVLNVMVNNVYYVASEVDVLGGAIKIISDFFRMQQVNLCSFFDVDVLDGCFFDTTQEGVVVISRLQERRASVCPRNSAVVNSLCVCEKGHETSACVACPQGFYQSSEEVGYMSKCTMCPLGTTTSGVGSIFSDQCYLKSRRAAVMGFSSLEPETKGEWSSSLVLLLAVLAITVMIVGYLIVHYAFVHYYGVAVDEAPVDPVKSEVVVYPGHLGFMGYRGNMKRDEDLIYKGTYPDLNIDDDVLRLLNMQSRRGVVSSGF